VTATFANVLDDITETIAKKVISVIKVQFDMNGTSRTMPALLEEFGSHRAVRDIGSHTLSFVSESFREKPLFLNIGKISLNV